MSNIVSAEEIKALMANFAECKAEYAESGGGVDTGELFHYACQFQHLSIQLQTLLNQAAEDIMEARELCDLILGYPPETQIKGAIESKAFDLAHNTIVTLAAITPYLTKEGE